jgi:uncharacterized membrane protein YfcA
MSLLTLALIGGTIVLSSFLSGVFGLAGGMVLLGVLLVFLDVTAGMVLFSVIQFFANGWRAIQWWGFVRWRIFWFYCLGGAVAFAVMRSIAHIPHKALVYFLLGLMPFLIELIPARVRPNIEWRGVPFLTGVLTTIVQFLTGVGGLFLDIFFQKSLLDRKTTLATKAVAQTASHVLRASYFISFGSIGDEIGLWNLLGAIALAIGGTALAPYVIERMSDHDFRQWTRAIILTISGVYIGRAAWLVWQG